VALLDATEIPCGHCGRTVPVPPEYRRAVETTRQTDAERAAADALWRQFGARRVSLAPALVLMALPGLYLVIGLVIGALAAAGVLDVGVGPRPLMAMVLWAPLPLVLAAAYASYWFVLEGRRQRHAMGVSLAALVGPTPGCRGCGAPLAVRAGDLHARCLYCGTESLVTPDAMSARAMRKDLEGAQLDAKQAVDTIAERRGRARFTLLGIGIMVAVLCAPPCVWALLPQGYRASDIGFAGLSVLLLGVLTFWAPLLTYGDARANVRVGDAERRRTGALPGIAAALGVLCGAAYVAIVLLEPPQPLAVGEHVRVEWRDHKTYGGTILATKPGQYRVHYDGYPDSMDDWQDAAHVTR
jgi:hypothetical protein